MVYKKYPVRLMAADMESLTQSSWPVNVAGGTEVFRPCMLVKVGEPVNKSATQLTVLEVKHNLGNEALIEHLHDIFSAQKKAWAGDPEGYKNIGVMKDLYVDFKTVGELYADADSAYGYDKYSHIKVVIQPMVLQPIPYSLAQFEDFSLLISGKILLGDTPILIDPYNDAAMAMLLGEEVLVDDGLKFRVRALCEFVNLLKNQVFASTIGVGGRITRLADLKIFFENVMGQYHELGAREKKIFQFYQLSELREGVTYNKNMLAYLRLTLIGTFEENGKEKNEPITETCWWYLVRHYQGLYADLVQAYTELIDLNPDTLDLTKLQVSEYPSVQEYRDTIVVYSQDELVLSHLDWFYILREDFSLSLVPQRVRYDISRRMDARVNNLPEGKSFTCISDPTNKYCDDLFVQYVQRCQKIYREMLLPRELRELKGNKTEKVAGIGRTIGSLCRDINDYFYSKWSCQTYRTRIQHEYYETNKSKVIFFNKELVTDYLMGYVPLFTIKVGANATIAADMFNPYKMMIKNWILPLSLDLLKKHPMKESLNKAVTLESPIYIPQRDFSKDEPGMMVRMTKGKQEEGDTVEVSIPGNAATVHLTVNFLLIMEALETSIADVDSFRFIQHLIHLAEM